MNNAYEIVMKYAVDEFKNKKIEDVLTVDVKSLGIDSLSIINILVDIEKEIGREIDYLNFDFERLSTIEKIGEVINEFK